MLVKIKQKDSQQSVTSHIGYEKSKLKSHLVCLLENFVADSVSSGNLISQSDDRFLKELKDRLNNNDCDVCGLSAFKKITITIS